MNDILKQLFDLQDVTYKEFHSKLMPSVNKDTIIGIRVPVLRKYAKSIQGTQEANEFLNNLPHTYYEENNLHILLISDIQDYAICLYEIERFLPFIDNWATCDFPAPKCFSKHSKDLIKHIENWIHSSQPYTIRYGIGMLMRLYLDEDFDPAYLQWVADIDSDEYYVNMMIAWYFATGLAKQWDAVFPYIQNRCLSSWVHAKTIQKAVESYRISDKKKVLLKSFR